jgi:deferrochelatase/peroxidase EfeB
MNLRPGIDTPPTANFLLAKLNIPFDDQSKVVQMLTELDAVRREAVDPDRQFNGRSVVDGWALNLLVGFGLRFFLGPLADRQPEEVIPNFPPGGVFTPRSPNRFDIMDRAVPLYLRTMNAAGDREWVGRRLAVETGGSPSDADIDAAYLAWLSDNESDLLLYIEANTPFICADLWKQIHDRVVEPYELDLAMPLDESYGRGDGRDLIGWHDPISNMDDLIKDRPQYYRSKIYLPHPAPAFPGENMLNRDDTRYDGGTYLVHRKYVTNLDRWNSDDFTITDNYGRTHTGEEARSRAVGRDRETGCVIRASDGASLEREYDSEEAHLAPLDSHILMVRGGNPAPFKGPFPPLAKGDVHAFNIQDVRVRRRGGNWREIDSETGKVTYGLHFVCFQNNIQQTGFEFINNIWLLNPMFRLNSDHILDPDKGISEPVGGGYYFVPPPHRNYPGEVFFE